MARKGKLLKKGGVVTLAIVFVVGVAVGYLGKNQIAKILAKGKSMTGMRARTVGAYYAPSVRRR